MSRIELADAEILKLLGRKPQSKKDMDVYRLADKLAAATALRRQVNRFDNSWQQYAPLMAYLDVIPPTNVGYQSTNDVFDLEAAILAAPTVHQIINASQLTTALSVANPGDVIILKDSLGTQDIANWGRFTTTRAGTESAPIVIAAETPGAGVIFTRASIYSTADFFRLNVSDYVIHGLRFQDVLSCQSLFQVNAPRIRISNNRLNTVNCRYWTGTDWNGTQGWLRVNRYGSNCEIDHNHCTSLIGSGRIEFRMPDTEDGTLTGPRWRSGYSGWPTAENPTGFHIHHNTTDGTFGSGSLWLQLGQNEFYWADYHALGYSGNPDIAGHLWQVNGLVEYNHFAHGGNSAECPTIKAGGITMRYNFWDSNQASVYLRAGKGNYFYGNYRKDTPRTGGGLFNIAGQQDFTFHSNLGVQTGGLTCLAGIYTGTGGYRTTLGESTIPSNTNVLVANNTIYSQASYFSDAAIYHNRPDGTVDAQMVPPTNVKFYNNIVYYPSSAKPASLIGTQAGGPVNTTVSHNLVYASGGGLGALFTGSTGLVQADPLLDSNYAPTEPSPAREAGTWVDGIDTDIFGNQRDAANAVDIGMAQVTDVSAGPTTPILLFTDTFTEAYGIELTAHTPDYNAPGGNWMTSAGTSRVQVDSSNQALRIRYTPTNYSAVKYLGIANQRVEVTVSPEGSGNEPLIMINRQNITAGGADDMTVEGECYAAHLDIDGNQLRILKLPAAGIASETVLTSKAYTLSATGTYKVLFENLGGQLSLSIDDVEELTVEDTPTLDNLNFALGTYGDLSSPIFFDTVNAWELTSAATTPSANLTLTSTAPLAEISVNTTASDLALSSSAPTLTQTTTEVKTPARRNLSLNATAPEITGGASYLARGFTATHVAELSKNVVSIGHLVKLEFDGGTLFFTDRQHDVSYNGDDYLANGEMLGVADLEEAIEMRSHNITLTFSGVSQSTLAELLANPYVLRPVTIYFAFFDASYALVDDPIEKFTGTIDDWQAHEDPNDGTSIIEVSVVSHWADFDRVNGRRTNPESQAAAGFPTDTGFNYVTQIIKDLKWGKAS